ncbi:hypothetical protein DFQ27_005369 [Actinomortierella ambigua]|uniref:Uncharacterized protein n=1 Tax=Actinomortierella ambigua TaxID=1343610 RepID=A0A9P6PZ07_9FUNG|nr:hypothetical protein DFQ27_005369 [Actinomortierella ambigua]
MDIEQETSPREAFLECQHMLSTIDWTDVLLQPQGAADALLMFDKHMTDMLQGTLGNTKKLESRALSEILMAYLCALQRLRLYLSAEPESPVAKAYKGDPELLIAIEESILRHVDALISSTVTEWQGRQKFELRLDPKDENELNNQHYLLIYVLLRILDQWVSPEPMNASVAYFERNYPRYHVQRPSKASSPESQSLSSEAKASATAKERVLQHLSKAMDFARRCHLSVESLLAWKPTPVFTTGVSEEDDSFDEDALIEDNFPLSETGICVLVAGMIYNMCCRERASPKGGDDANNNHINNHTNVDYSLPMALAQDWVFTQAGGLASGFLTSETSQFQMADKALLVLLYAIDHLPADHLAMERMDACTMDSATDRMGLFQIFQVMVTFAATCPSSQHRFLTFQGLDHLIQASQDEVKLYCLEQLISPQCPFETMRAASINLLKGCVERGFQRYEDGKKTEAIDQRQQQQQQPLPPRSVFASPLLLKAFQTHLWRVDGNAFARDPLEDEDKWEEQYDTFMHALNFYLYLLIRDSESENLTEVWLTSNVRETHHKFVSLLKKRADALHAAYQAGIAEKQVNEAGDGPSAEASMKEGDLPTHTIQESKHGVLQVDIEYETSGDEEMEEVEVGARQKSKRKTKASRIKESTLPELFQKLLRVELIQELLSTIIQKTRHLLQED